MSREFDVFDPHLNLTQNHFLEASAGTGKTFTLEQIVLRLLATGIPLERILLMTFTRAATLELKERLRKKLQHLPLASFDQAQILTIHSFCFQSLKNHAFIAGVCLEQREENDSPLLKGQIYRDFLRTQLTAEEIHPKQLELVLKSLHHDPTRLLAALDGPSLNPGRSFGATLAKIKAEIVSMRSERSSVCLLEELLAHAPRFLGLCNRKREIKPAILTGLSQFVEFFSSPDTQDAAPLIAGPLLQMTPDNLGRNQLFPPLLVPWQERLLPLLKEISDPSRVLDRLAQRAQAFLASRSENQDLFFYDTLLKRTHAALKCPKFVTRVRSEYDAVLIDEFQDTDPLQWEIFSTLFLGHCPLYLVGDPKQSIYRFRGADLYTYCRAREQLGPSARATLSRNFRAEPRLVAALNALFSKTPNLITLPKTAETIPLAPISSAQPESQKGGITFCRASSETSLYAFIDREIRRCHHEEQLSYRSMAVLVKDRYQAKRLCHFLRQRGLPFLLRRSESLFDSDAYLLLEEILEAVLHPDLPEALAKLLMGPLFAVPLELVSHEILQQRERFYQYHLLLKRAGVVALIQRISQDSSTLPEAIYLDLLHLAEKLGEELVESAVKRGLFASNPLFLLQHLKEAYASDADHFRARPHGEEDAVQILTLHMSKGLEFSLVFPIGVAMLFNPEEAEECSEKMRQLYVALTRAKERVYIPFSDKEKTPIGYFLNRVLQGECIESWLAKAPHLFSLVECVLEEKPDPLPLHPPRLLTRPEPLVTHAIAPIEVRSYTSLTANPATLPISAGREPSSLAAGPLPAGKEMGILLHFLLEKLCFSWSEDQLQGFLKETLAKKAALCYLPEIKALLMEVLHAELPAPAGSFTLAEIHPHKLFREQQFFYPLSPPHTGYMRGVIDLFFEHQGSYYLIDWKGHVLQNYSLSSLHEAMQREGYFLQAELYQRAAQRFLARFSCDARLAGSFYLFLRGMVRGTDKGIVYIPIKSENY